MASKIAFPEVNETSLSGESPPISTPIFFCFSCFNARFLTSKINGPPPALGQGPGTKEGGVPLLTDHVHKNFKVGQPPSVPDGLPFAGNDHFSFQLNTGFFQDRIPDMFDN